MSIKLIACVDPFCALDGFRPPKLDLQRFATLTIGGTVIMGRKTWDTLPADKRPLPHRRNIVATRVSMDEFGDRFPGADGRFCGDWTAYPGAWVIGGGEIYRQALPYVDTIYLSVTTAAAENATVFLPNVVTEITDNWAMLKREVHQDHTFAIWQRKDA